MASARQQNLRQAQHLRSTENRAVTWLPLPSDRLSHSCLDTGIQMRRNRRTRTEPAIRSARRGGYCFGTEDGFTSPQSAPRYFISLSLCITWVPALALFVVASVCVVTRSSAIVASPLPEVVTPFAVQLNS